MHKDVQCCKTRQEPSCQLGCVSSCVSSFAAVLFISVPVAYTPQTGHRVFQFRLHLRALLTSYSLLVSAFPSSPVSGSWNGHQFVQRKHRDNCHDWCCHFCCYVKSQQGGWPWSHLQEVLLLEYWFLLVVLWGPWWEEVSSTAWKCALRRLLSVSWACSLSPTSLVLD